jgi:hypothetical protein
LINFLAFVTLPDEEDDIVDVVVVIQYNEGWRGGKGVKGVRIKATKQGTRVDGDSPPWARHWPYK